MPVALSPPLSLLPLLCSAANHFKSKAHSKALSRSPRANRAHVPHHQQSPPWSFHRRTSTASCSNSGPTCSASLPTRMLDRPQSAASGDVLAAEATETASPAPASILLHLWERKCAARRARHGPLRAAHCGEASSRYSPLTSFMAGLVNSTCTQGGAGTSRVAGTSPAPRISNS